MQLIYSTRLFLFYSLFFISFNLSAHSQSPISVQEISLYQNFKTEIHIGNESGDSALFDIELDGVVIEKDFRVGPKKTKSYHVTIKDITPNVVNFRRLCSISKPKIINSIRTKICTNVRVIYPKNKIDTLEDFDL